MAGTETPTTRPGGRSARVRAAVHQAVLDLLADGPQDAITMPQIAARAGVHPTTVYRRWATMADLLAEVAGSRFADDVVVPDLGSLAADLERWVTDVATDLRDPDALAVMRAAVGAGELAGCACATDRRQQLAAMLGREVERTGSAAGLPTVDQAADHLLGPVYFRALFTPEPAEPGWAKELVERLLLGTPAAA